MRTLIVLFSFGLIPLVPAAAQPTDGSPGYLQPPQEIVDILDAGGLPQVVPSPDGRTLAIFARKPMPPLAELAQPVLRLAGRRVNPRTSAPHRLPTLVGLSLQTVDGVERPVPLPADSRLMPLGFSPDGRQLAFGNVRGDGIELWIVDVAAV
jgi:hypothetical protein